MSSNFYSPRILLVEDHYVSRHLAERDLLNWGYEVAFAENGREALRLLQYARFDLLYTDGQLPHMNGFQLVKAIRNGKTEICASSTQRNLAILMVSAYGKKIRERAFAIGVDDYLIKPSDPDELRARIKLLMRIARLRSKIEFVDSLYSKIIDSSDAHGSVE